WMTSILKSCVRPATTPRSRPGDRTSASTRCPDTRRDFATENGEPRLAVFFYPDVEIPALSCPPEGTAATTTGLAPARTAAAPLRGHRPQTGSRGHRGGSAPNNALTVLATARPDQHFRAARAM